MDGSLRSEDEIGHRLDRCVSDILIKTGIIIIYNILGTGLFSGIVFSLIAAKSMSCLL